MFKASNSRRGSRKEFSIFLLLPHFELNAMRVLDLVPFDGILLSNGFHLQVCRTLLTVTSQRWRCSAGLYVAVVMM